MARQGEGHSRIISRYQRRTEHLDAALLGTYLSGINSRRLRGALSPLLRDEFTAWSTRDLAAEEVWYL